MSSSAENELVLDNFRDYVREKLNKGDGYATEYRLAASQLINYLDKLSPSQGWFVLLENERLISDFLSSEAKTLSPKTYSEKEGAIREFQNYIRRHGKLTFFTAWVARIKKHPLISIATFLIAIILGVATLGWPPERIVGLFFPTLTPTITATSSPTKLPTNTPFPSATLTLTPTITPTPNQTQIFLATHLPTAYPAFSQVVRTSADKSEQVQVPAGSFIAGDHSGIGFDDEVPHQVYTDGFWIDRFLVTNEQFASCPIAKCSQPHNFISHKRQDGYYGVPKFANYPVIQIDWWQAEIFCQWRGGRLPTEAEWEKAAGWNPQTSQMFIYPWGDQVPDKTLANYDNVDLDTTEVGSYPKGVSPVGAYDMAGDVWEWVSDWYGPYDLVSIINPVGPSSGKFKVIRGGSWGNKVLPIYLRVSNRGTNTPDHPTNEVGFRCVFSP